MCRIRHRNTHSATSDCLCWHVASESFVSPDERKQRQIAKATSKTHVVQCMRDIVFCFMPSLFGPQSLRIVNAWVCARDRISQPRNSTNRSPTTATGARVCFDKSNPKKQLREMKHRIRYRTLFDSNSHIHCGQIECSRRFMVLFRPEGLITHTPANVRQSRNLRNWKTSSSFVLFAQRAIYLARELCITYSVSVFANQKPDEVVDLHQTVCSRNLCDTHSDAECLLSAALPPHQIHFSFWKTIDGRFTVQSNSDIFPSIFWLILRFVSGHLNQNTWTKESVAAFCAIDDHEWIERGWEREKTLKENPKIDIPATCAL